MQTRPTHRWATNCPPPRGLVAPVRIDPTGRNGPTPDAAGGPRWRRTSRGFYVPADVDGSRPEQRIMEQAARLPRQGAVTGWASLRLAGANFFDGLAMDGATRHPVPLAIGAGRKIRADPLASVSREPLEPCDIVVRHGIPCTTVRRALFDEMRRVEDWREAVVAMDMAAAADVASIAQMRVLLRARSRWRRTRQVGRALDHASELSRSPNEVRMRLVWVVDAGLPPPLVNQDIFSRDGRLVAVADLLDPVAGVVGEYDGADHRGARRQSKDAEREDRLRRLGLECFKVTGPDLPRRSFVAARMASTRSRARFLPERERLWTLRPPLDWPRTETLDELLERRSVLAELYGG